VRIKRDRNDNPFRLTGPDTLTRPGYRLTVLHQGRTLTPLVVVLPDVHG